MTLREFQVFLLRGTCCLGLRHMTIMFGVHGVHGVYEYCLPATTHALLLLAAQDKPKLSPNQGHMSQVVLSIMNE